MFIKSVFKNTILVSWFLSSCNDLDNGYLGGFAAWL